MYQDGGMTKDTVWLSDIQNSRFGDNGVYMNGNKGNQIWKGDEDSVVYTKNPEDYQEYLRNLAQHMEARRIQVSGELSYFREQEGFGNITSERLKQEEDRLNAITFDDKSFSDGNGNVFPEVRLVDSDKTHTPEPRVQEETTRIPLADGSSKPNLPLNPVEAPNATPPSPGYMHRPSQQHAGMLDVLERGDKGMSGNSWDFVKRIPAEQGPKDPTGKPIYQNGGQTMNNKQYQDGGSTETTIEDLRLQREAMIIAGRFRKSWSEAKQQEFLANHSDNPYVERYTANGPVNPNETAKLQQDIRKMPGTNSMDVLNFVGQQIGGTAKEVTNDVLGTTFQDGGFYDALGGYGSTRQLSPYYTPNPGFNTGLVYGQDSSVGNKIGATADLVGQSFFNLAERLQPYFQNNTTTSPYDPALNKKVQGTKIDSTIKASIKQNGGYIPGYSEGGGSFTQLNDSNATQDPFLYPSGYNMGTAAMEAAGASDNSGELLMKMYGQDQFSPQVGGNSGMKEEDKFDIKGELAGENKLGVSGALGVAGEVGSFTFGLGKDIAAGIGVGRRSRYAADRAAEKMRQATIDQGFEKGEEDVFNQGYMQTTGFMAQNGGTIPVRQPGTPRPHIKSEREPIDPQYVASLKAGYRDVYNQPFLMESDVTKGVELVDKMQEVGAWPTQALPTEELNQYWSTHDKIRAIEQRMETEGQSEFLMGERNRLMQLKDTLGTQVFKQNGGTIPVSMDGLNEYPKQPVVVPSNNITMKGIPYDVLATPNNDAPVVMKPGQNYKFPNSTEVLEQPILQDGGNFVEVKPKYTGTSVLPEVWDANPDDVKSFLLSYINSPKYRERLEGSLYGKIGEADSVDEVIRARSEAVDKAKFNYQDDSPSLLSGIVSTLTGGAPYSTAGSNANPKNNRGSDIIIDKKQATDLGMSLPEVKAHELGHLEVGIRNNNNTNLNLVDRSMLRTRLSNRTEDKHDLDPDENKSDLDALRYLLHQNGVDVMNEDIKMEQIEALPSGFIRDRMLRNYNMRDLLYLLNSVASAEVTPVLNMAQNGGLIKLEDNLSYDPATNEFIQA